MRAAVVTESGRMSVVEVPDPVPMDHQALIAVEVCGVCGTDLHVLDGDYGVVRYPVIAGHEFAGTVVAVGRAARGLQVGDRVAVDPMDYCDACALCRAGWTNMCLNGGGLGTTAPGAFAELVAVNAARCEVLPDELGFDAASLIEPLSCVLHGVDRIGPVLGQPALVFGAGPIGLMLTALLDRAGAVVDVVDVNPARLGLAPAFGAHDTGCAVTDFSRASWPVVLDATGNPAAVAAALAATGRSGRLGLLGVSGPGRTFPFEPFDVVARELTIVGINSVRHTFGRARRLLGQGVIPVELLHGKPFTLDDIAAAFEATRHGEGLKTRIRISEDGS